MSQDGASPNTAAQKDRRALALAFAWWLAAVAVIALSFGLGTLTAAGCADDSGCSDAAPLVTYVVIASVSVLPLWAVVGYLLRWRSGGRLVAGWRGLVLALVLMAYAQVGFLVWGYLGGWAGRDDGRAYTDVVLGALLVTAWFPFCIWLVSAAARRMFGGQHAAG